MKFKRSHQFLCDAPSAVALAGVMFMLLFYLLSNSALLLTEGASLVGLYSLAHWTIGLWL